MDRDTAITLIKARMKRAGDTNLDELIVAEMQLVQSTDLEGGPNLPWFLLSENLSAATTADEERVHVPINVEFTGNDFIREFEEGALWLYNNDEGKYELLPKDDYDIILAKYPGGGKPKKYSLNGDYFRFRPLPDVAYTLRMKCYLRDRTLSTNIENDWLKWAPDLMIAKVGAKIARYHLRDEKVADMLDNEATTAASRLLVQDTARKQANLELTMGDL